MFDTTSRPYPCLLSSIHQHILVCILQILNDLQEAGGHAIALEVCPKGSPRNGIRSSPPLDPPKHGQIAFLPTCWPHFQTQPCTTCTYVIKSQAVLENARLGRIVCAFGHPGTILHPFGRQMVHPQTCSNPATFPDFSCSYMMI